MLIVDRWSVLLFRWILMRFLRKQSWKMMVAITRTGSITWGLSHCCIEELRPESTAGCQACCKSNTRSYERLAEQSWWLLDSSVCHALRLRIGTSTTFWTSWSIWDDPGVEVNISSKCPSWEISSLQQVLYLHDGGEKLCQWTHTQNVWVAQPPVLAGH